MNGFSVSELSSWKLCWALLGVFSLACSGEDAQYDAAPAISWPGADLVAAEWTSEDHALIVSRGGEIYRTEDAGDSWHRSHVPVVSSLRAIAMSDGLQGWVVGDGVILRTDDGGSRWRRQRLPGLSASMRLRGVSVMGAGQAIVIGENGIVLRTRDRGGSWEEVLASRAADAEPRSPMRDIFCSPDPEARCWATGSGLRQIESDEGRWHSLVLHDFATMSPVEFDLGQVELPESEEERLRAFVASNRLRIHLNWIIEPGIGAGELDAMGRHRDPSTPFDLMDARLQEVRNAIEEQSVSPRRIVVLGAPPWGYEEYLDEDAHLLERYWEGRLALGAGLRILLRDRLELESVQIAGSGLGLAVGRSGAIVRSEDGGDHWRTVIRPTPHDLYGVGIGHRRVVAVGAQGGLWTSDDQGRHWISPGVGTDTAPFDALLAVAFSPSGKIGIVVSEKGRILRSLDGGETWAELRPD